MCSSGCCIKDIRWENGVLQILKGGVWANVSGTPGTSFPPNIPPLDPDELPTQTNACFKINGVWNLFERMIDGHFDAWESASPETPLTIYLRMGHLYPEIKLDNYRHMSFWTNWTGEDRSGLLIEWNTYKADLKELVLCQFQDIFSKDGILSDADLAAWKDHIFAVGGGDLGDFLTDALDNPEDSHYKEQASYAIADATGICDCVGSEPTPPEPEIPEGFGRIEVELVDSIYPPNSPQTFPTPTALAATAGMGAKLSDTAYETTLIPAGNNKVLGLLVTMPAGWRITNAKWSVIWTGATSGRTWWVGLYPSTGALVDFTTYFEANAQPPATLTPGVAADNPGFAGTHYLYISYGTIGTVAGDDTKISVSNLRFDIAKDDGSQTRLNVAPNVLFSLA